MTEQKGFPFIRTPKQKEAHKAYLDSLKSEQKDKCPKCKGTKLISKENGLDAVGDVYVAILDCPTCNGTGEKKLDSPKGGC